ncbi:hypothetical protein NC651_010397 [Populus alba x Populus x berolinensis]|nr:hypothetical protein NC651_010397 [Populus alba x Populus x berolinensis]
MDHVILSGAWRINTMPCRYKLAYVIDHISMIYSERKKFVQLPESGEGCSFQQTNPTAFYCLENCLPIASLFPSEMHVTLESVKKHGDILILAMKYYQKAIFLRLVYLMNYWDLMYREAC